MTHYTATEHSTLRRMRRDGRTNAAIGEALGRSETSVRVQIHRLRRAGALDDESRNEPWTDADLAVLLAMRARLASSGAIAQVLRRSKASIQVMVYRLRRAGREVTRQRA